MHRLWILAVLLIPCAVVQGQSAPLDDALATLRPGDLLRVTVWDDPKFTGEFEVAADSTLRHPVYNRLKVAGVPTSELRGRFTTFLRGFQREPLVEVEPLFKVTVTGQVRNPSIYSLAPGTTVSEAVARAGGSSEGARLRNVSLLRNGGTIRVDLTSASASQGGRTIRSGDEIAVPIRRNVLRDYVGPIASMTATVASLLTLAIRSR